MFLAAREGNDRQTAGGINSIKSITTFVGEHATYLALDELVSTNVVNLPNETLDSQPDA